MKIAITFTDQEQEKASAAVFELSKLFPFRQKTTPPKDGYTHCYLSIREPIDATTENGIIKKKQVPLERVSLKRGTGND